MITERRSFIGGSDARVIMGNDEAKLVRLWREKRGEADSEDLSQDLLVQLGTVTEGLNRTWYERCTGHPVHEVQRRVRHPIHKWMGATLDGKVEGTGAVFEAKFMLPWNFSEEGAAEKHMAQLQHNMWVTAARTAVLSIITGGGKWVEMTIPADPLYQHLLLTAERKFWRCVQSGELPHLFGVEPPRPRLEAVRVVEMNGSNSWAEFAAIYRNTRQAFLEHERAKTELKVLVPEDAKEASGHGVRAKRSKSGAISFELMAKAAYQQIPGTSLREQLGAIGRSGEHMMLLNTGGVNTHRGAIWTLGLLVSAAAMGSTSPEVIAGWAGQLACLPDRNAPKQQSNGSRVSQRYPALVEKSRLVFLTPSTLACRRFTVPVSKVRLKGRRDLMHCWRS